MDIGCEVRIPNIEKRKTREGARFELFPERLVIQEDPRVAVLVVEPILEHMRFTVYAISNRVGGGRKGRQANDHHH